MRELGHLYKTAAEAMNKPGEHFVGGPVLQIADGSGNLVDFDAVVHGIQSFLYLTVSMLAYENGWWTDNGLLVLPSRVFPTKSQLLRVGIHMPLATAWDSLCAIDETLRFFGGDAELLEDDEATQTDQKKFRMIFMHRAQEQIQFHVARLRLGQLQVEAALNWALLGVEKYSDPTTASVQMPPLEMVSRDESDAIFLLQATYCYDLESNILIGGLSPMKWIRGYAVIKRCFVDTKKVPPYSILHLRKEKLRRVLRNGCLTDSEVDIFLRGITFSKDSADFFDRPLLQAGDGELYFLSGFYYSVSILDIAISQWRSMGYTSASKGETFQREIVDLFKEHGIVAKTISFKDKETSETFEFDCIVAWGNHLFVIECKNYLLPTFSPAEEFHFLESVDEAVDQALRLKYAVAKHPELIREKLGVSVSGMRCVPVVLNAMPFSMLEPRKGVYVCDSATLGKFFEGRLSVKQILDKGENEKVTVEHVIHKFWSGDAPTAEDLFRCLAAPPNLQAEYKQWQYVRKGIAISSRCAIEFDSLKRDEVSLEGTLGGLGLKEGQIQQVRKVMTALWQTK